MDMVVLGCQVKAINILMYCFATLASDIFDRPGQSKKAVLTTQRGDLGSLGRWTMLARYLLQCSYLIAPCPQLIYNSLHIVALTACIHDQVHFALSCDV